MTQATLRGVVSPLRFTAHAAETSKLLQLLGLSAAARQGDFVTLQGRAGRVTVHPLATAESIAEPTTSLVFDVQDAVATIAVLVEAGFSATWWDESWGRQARVQAALGDVWLNDELSDTYGFDLEPEVESEVTVVASVTVRDPEGATRLLQLLGFTPDPMTSSDVVLRSGSSGGALRLRRGAANPGHARIGIETPHDLADLAEWAQASGFTVKWHGADRSHLSVTAPDGSPIDVSAPSNPRLWPA